MDTLKKHLPFSGQEGLHEAEKIAVRFEEKIYTAATSQSDYLQKISLNMLSMETKSQNTMANSLPSNTVSTSNRPPDPSKTMKSILMNTNSLRPIQGGEPTMDTSDWRTRLLPDSRQRIVDKIMDTLKKHLPFYGQEGLHELKKIAIRFEEKIYAAATSQSDYLRKISFKMLAMDTKSQNTIANSLPSNTVGTSRRPPDPVLMNNNNLRPIQGGEPTTDTSDWRIQLLPDSRQRIVNKIMDALKKHLTFSGQEGLHELKKIASDYLRKISLRMLLMETKSCNTIADSLPSNTVSTSNRPPNAGKPFLSLLSCL